MNANILRLCSHVFQSPLFSLEHLIHLNVHDQLADEISLVRTNSRLASLEIRILLNANTGILQ